MSRRRRASARGSASPSTTSIDKSDAVRQHRRRLLRRRRRGESPMKMGKSTEEPGLYKTRDGYAVQCKAKSGSVTTWKRKKLPGATRAEAMLALEQLRREAAEEADAKNRKEDPQRT